MEQVGVARWGGLDSRDDEEPSDSDGTPKNRQHTKLRDLGRDLSALSSRNSKTTGFGSGCAHLRYDPWELTEDPLWDSFMVLK